MQQHNPNRRTVLRWAGALATPVILAPPVRAEGFDLMAAIAANVDEINAGMADLTGEGASDLTEVHTTSAIRGTAQDRAAIADGMLVLYNKPRRDGQAADVLRVGMPRNGEFSASQLEDIAYAFRDMRNDQQIQVDSSLVKGLSHICLTLGVPLLGTSLYRSPQTNAMLRRGSPNVARNSFHMGRVHNDGVRYAMAADLRCELGVPALRRAVLAAQAAGLIGGVGRYSRFAHVDTGPVRRWG